MKGVAVLGSTGSIGVNTLDVLSDYESHFRVVGISGHSNHELLRSQMTAHQPRLCCVTDPLAFERVSAGGTDESTTLLRGSEGLLEIVRDPDVEIVVLAVLGAAGLPAAIETVRLGKRLALANKESLVMAGSLVMGLAAEHDAEILPVDSEHNALFQALPAGRRQDIRRLILTASGGPFRTVPAEELPDKTPDEALAHPTWNMGRKISIDSATMMNKALEIVEARWLFDVPADRLEVAVHPQSLIHSLVEFVDGSVVAQMGPPDMRLPIQYALTYPERLERSTPTWSISDYASMTLEAPDFEKFDSLRLGFEAARIGGTAGAVLNAANEIAVEHFLDHRIRFGNITEIVREVMERHDVVPADSLDVILEADAWAREQALDLCERVHRRRLNPM